MISALSGTRMGRKVKTVDQVLAECANNRINTSDVEISNPEDSAETPSVSQTEGSDAIASKIKLLENGNFLFFDVPYQGGVLDGVERPMRFLDDGAEKTQEEHLLWLSKRNNKPYGPGWTMADMELEYQLLRICFDLRTDKTFGAIANSYIQQIGLFYDSWILTADRITNNGGLESVITNKGTIQSSAKKVLVPAFNGESLVLSREREETELDSVYATGSITDDFLKSYLGVGSERAGIILSYCATRKLPAFFENPKIPKLRETRLWTAPHHSESVGGLGVNGLQFSISAKGDTKETVKRALAVGYRMFFSSAGAKK